MNIQKPLTNILEVKNETTTKKKVYVVTAPSGSGKGTVLNRLRRSRNDVKIIKSYTTRKSRGKSDYYHFISEAEFRKMQENNDFLETNYYDGNYYGTTVDSVNEALAEVPIVILELDVSGLKQVRDSGRYDVVSIFIITPSPYDIIARLKARGTETSRQIKHRLERACEEIDVLAEGDFDYILINEEVKETLEALNSVLDREIVDKMKRINTDEFKKGLKSLINEM